jgi:hypothetical protein
VASGLAGIGAAAGGLGVAVLALQGFDKALKALSTYELDPTIENLQKLRIEEEKLGPAGAEFLHFLDQLQPQLKDLQNVARAGLFPGVEAGIDDLLTRLPLVRQTVNRISQELGRLSADAGSALASDEWTPFFNYIRTNAAPILDDFARSTGNVALGLRQHHGRLQPPVPRVHRRPGGHDLPVRRLVQAPRRQPGVPGLPRHRRAGRPRARGLRGSTIQLLAGVAKASAPLGEVTLPILTGILKVLASIADSDAGPALYAAAAGMIALNRAASSKAIGSLSTAFLDLRTSPNLAATAIQRFGGVAKIAAGAAGMGLFLNSLHETDQGLRTLEGAAGGALAGFSVGGPWGAAIGGAIGLVASLGHANDQASQDVQDFTSTLDEQTGALTANSRAMAVKKLADSGALDAAKDLGLNLQLVTDAALGNEAAQTRLNAALSAYDQTQHAAAGTRAVAGNADVAASVNQVRDAVEGTSTAVKDSQSAFDQQAAAMGATTPKVNELRGAYEGVSTAAADLQTQLTELDNFLSKRGTFRAYEASLDAFRDSLKKAPHDFSAFTDAGRTNLGNLDQVITDTEAHLKTITDPTGRKQANFLDDVFAQLRNIAKTSPEAAAAVQAVVPELQKVRDANKAVVIKADNADALKKAVETREALHDLATSRNRPTISADNSPAERTIAGTKGQLDDLNGTTAHPHINVDPGNSFSILGGIRSELARIVSKTITVTVKKAAGALTGFGIAAGGTVPGPRTPYGDKVLAHLAPGEEVISNSHGQADRFRSDRAAGRIPAYAAGGTVEDRIASTYTSRYRGYADGGTVDPSSDSTDSTDKKHKKPRPPFTAFLPEDVLKGLQTAADKVKKSYDKEKSKLDDLISQRDSLASSIASAAVHDPFGNGVAGLDAQVEADTGDIDAMTAALATLVKNGLDPKSALYQQLAASMDVNTAQQLAQLSSADLQARRGGSSTVPTRRRRSAARSRAGVQRGDRDQTKATRELRHRR